MPVNLYIDCNRPFEQRVQIAIQGPNFGNARLILNFLDGGVPLQ